MTQTLGARQRLDVSFGGKREDLGADTYSYLSQQLSFGGLTPHFLGLTRARVCGGDDDDLIDTWHLQMRKTPCTMEKTLAHEGKA
jgi:hypothetical protein